MQLIDGKRLAHGIREKIKAEITHLATPPGLAVLLVGEDPASHVYVNLKEQAAQEAGIRTDIRRLPSQTPDNELERIIAAWNADPAIHGILIQHPLPAGHDIDKLVNAMDPRKDVDGFHPATIARLRAGSATVISPVHEAVLRSIAKTGVDPRGKSATILANSHTFAEPLAYLLQRAGFMTAHMNAETLNADTLRSSDVIITALGRPGFVGPDIVKSSNAILIDVGTAKDDRGRIHGDVDATAFTAVDGWLTPVPGGIGPMTVALLLQNTLLLAKNAIQ
jgi:methylenetetrahydrofolate dehydrogenase (NADP+) / methenyltetrahydrofolate cyclohydrolase